MVTRIICDGCQGVVHVEAPRFTIERLGPIEFGQQLTYDVCSVTCLQGFAAKLAAKQQSEARS